MSEAGRLGWLAGAENRAAENTHRLAAYELNPAFCSLCKNLLSYQKRHNKYCSSSCSASATNSSRRKIKNCIGCQKPGVKALYCSNKCQKLTDFKKRVEDVQKSGVLYVGSGSRTGKTILIFLRGNCCELCRQTKVINPLTKELVDIPLILDHIDGNSNENSLFNMRLVCGICDMFLPTYKSKNIGNGRHSRRLRYSKGQSY
jgi:hypothetical protein